MNFIDSRTLTASPSVAALAVLLALAGCGGADEDGSEGSEGTQPKAEFVAAADAICTEAAAEIDAEVQARFEGPGANPDTQDLTDLFTEVTLPTLQRQIDEIAALPPPEGEEEAAQAVIDEVNAAIAESEENPDALLVPSGGSTPFDEANRLAQEFGFQECGQAEAE